MLVRESKNRPVLVEKLQKLQSLKQDLSPKDRAFADSLTEYFNRKETLSFKQADWVDKLIERANDVGETTVFPACDGIKNIYNKMHEAKENGIQKPRLIIDKSLFTVMGIRINWQGAMYCFRDTPETGFIVLGYLKEDGRFQKHVARSSSEAKAARQLLCAFGEDMEQNLKVLGKRTGICGCCGRELTNPESIEAGIGPICASKYGF